MPTPTFETVLIPASVFSQYPGLVLPPPTAVDVMIKLPSDVSRTLMFAPAVILTLVR